MTLYNLFREALYAQRNMPGSQTHLNLVAQIRKWLAIVCPAKRGWKVDLDGVSYLLVRSTRGSETFFSFVEVKKPEAIQKIVCNKIIFTGNRLINMILLYIFTPK